MQKREHRQRLHSGPVQSSRTHTNRSDVCYRHSDACVDETVNQSQQGQCRGWSCGHNLHAHASHVRMSSLPIKVRRYRPYRLGNLPVRVPATNTWIRYEKLQTFYKKANRGPRLTPEGFRPRHPRRGGRRVGNAGHHGKRRQRERAQATARVHQTSSKHTFARLCLMRASATDVPTKRIYISYIAGKNRALRNRAGTRGKDAERIQELRHANVLNTQKVADIRRVKSRAASSTF
jgi:hypothetical protein